MSSIKAGVAADLQVKVMEVLLFFSPVAIIALYTHTVYVVGSCGDRTPEKM